jgi:PAS domain S-box-containing protein
MVLDTQTVLATDALLALVLGGFALIEGLGQRGARHLVPWGAANLLIGAAIGGMLLNTVLPSVALPVLCNVLLVGFSTMCLAAARMCNGRAAGLWFAGLGVAVGLAVAVLAFAVASFADRVGIGQGISAAGLLAAAWEFSRGRGVRLESRRAAVWLFGAHGLVVAFRAVVTALPHPPPALGMPVPHMALFAIEGMVFLSAGTFVLLALAKERIYLEATAIIQAAHAETVAARGFLDNLIAGLPSVVYRGTFDSEGTFCALYVSANVERMTGWQVPQIATPLQFRDLVHPEDVAMFDAKNDTTRQDGAGTGDYRLRRPDGTWMWVRDRMRIAGTLPDGRLDVIGHASDITPEREAAAQAISAAKLATLGEMAGGLAQELEQPIGIMTAADGHAADVLRRRRDPADLPVLQRLERIVEQGARAREIVAHLRAFARHETGPPVPVDVAEVVRRAVRLMQNSLGLAEIAVTLDLPAGLPPAMAQAVALEQVLVNLLANARDALSVDHPRERRIRIVARAEAASGEVRLAISDTGDGIAADVLPRVFEPFFTTKAPGKASGLGLSVSYGIVRSFHGSITAGNGPDGAEFVITLPQAPIAAAAE